MIDFAILMYYYYTIGSALMRAQVIKPTVW